MNSIKTDSVLIVNSPTNVEKKSSKCAAMLSLFKDTYKINGLYQKEQQSMEYAL